VSVRLHLGCGLVHRANWINLDHYPTGAADLLADAILLPFPDGSAEAVEALQLVEHLGYVGTLYALHEWARVLAPGGTLCIETPDRAATLSAALSDESEKAALPWLFGMEERGLIHRYLFSADELTHMVGKAGFTDVTLRNAIRQPARPTLALSARRAADTRRHRLANRLRRAFILAGLVDPMDASQHMSALERICERACELAEVPDHATLDQVLSLSVRYSPRAAACLLRALSAFSVWPDEELAQARHLVADLEREQFPARLACRWRAIPKLPGTTDSAWASFEREISLYLAARLCPGEGLDDVKAAFDASTAHPSPADQCLKLFCRAALTDLARQLTARGVRAFAQGDLESAREAFETALSYDPTLVWPRWNLARLHMRGRQPLDALRHYEALQVDLPAGLRTVFERELDAVTERRGDWARSVAPLADVFDLLTEAT
jgi:predicted SAM-dependent methyltransferase/tetratricopeptide (TPR) repeat protein